MEITWEDRKSSGRIDEHFLSEKPAFSFEYAWFLVTDETAQYVETHDHDCCNKDMTDEQRQEVFDFYTIHTTPKPAPSSALKIIIADGVEQDEKGNWVQIWTEVDKFQDILDGPTKAEQEADYLAQKFEDEKTAKLSALKAHYDDIMADPHCDTGLGFQVDSGYPNLTDFEKGLAIGLLQVRAYDNTNHAVTPAEMQQIIDRIVAWGLALKIRKWALEDEIKTATAETIAAIDITTGWPT